MALNQFFRNQNIPVPTNQEEQIQNYQMIQRQQSQVSQQQVPDDQQSHFTTGINDNTPVNTMNVGECVSEYLAIEGHLKTLRAETRKWNKRSKEIQTRMCSLLKSANKNKIDINKQITLSYEVKTQQVPLTKKNIRSTLSQHFDDPILIERIYKVLTEKRETYQSEKLKKKKYKE